MEHEADEYMFKPFHNNPSLTVYENYVTVSVYIKEMCWPEQSPRILIT